MGLPVAVSDIPVSMDLPVLAVSDIEVSVFEVATLVWAGKLTEDKPGNGSDAKPLLPPPRAPRLDNGSADFGAAGGIEADVDTASPDFDTVGKEPKLANGSLDPVVAELIFKSAVGVRDFTPEPSSANGSRAKAEPGLFSPGVDFDGSWDNDGTD